MAASAADYFKQVARRWVGQIGSGGVADGTTTTIPLASSTNLPTGTGVVVVIGRVNSNGTATPASEETITGVVSGNNLVSCTRGVEGTAQAHNAGDVVEVLVTASYLNDISTGLLVQHDQSGRHTNLTTCNITASGTITASHFSACDITALRTVLSSTVTASDITATRAMSASTVNASDFTATRNTSLCAVSASSVNANVIYGAWITDTTTASAVTMSLGVGGSNRHMITLSDSTTSIYVSGNQVGQSFVIRPLQNATGSRLVSWFPGSTIKWAAGGTPPTLTTTANKADVLGFLTTGASAYDGFVIGQNI